MQIDVTARGRWSGLKADFGLSRLPATLATGLVLATVNALLTVALMTLIFGAELRQALPIGIGAGLFASGLLALTIGVLSGFPGMYAGIQDSSAAILGLAAASIATSVAAPDEVDTVLAMIAVTSLATGLVFFLLGTFRLGEIARFVPFPVIGGLLAGTGYLILEGSLDILRNGLSTSDIMTIDALGLLWPGIALAGVFFVAARRRWPSKAYLEVLVGGVIAFHVITQTSGVGKDTSVARGWLLGPFPDGDLLPRLATDVFADADWSAILGEAASLGAILLIVPVTLLLFISALEVGTNTDLDLHAELRATGWANVAAGALGGPPGHLYLSDTLITHRVIGARRGPTVVAGLAVLGIALIGGTVLQFLPQFVIGGLLLFVGADFLFEWLWASRHRMTSLDYALMVGIVLIIATVGFLPGVAGGLVAAIALFVYRSSRIDVVKHLLTGRERQSNIERPRNHADYLVQRGNAVLVLELQGYIFFGTADQIVVLVKSRLRTSDSLRFVIFDFRLVTGVDSSAVAVFERIAQLATEDGLTVLLVGLEPANRTQFSGFDIGYGDVIRFESDLDHGLAWCEDRLLEDLEHRDGDGRTLPEGLAERLAPYLTTRTLPIGHPLMRQGDRTQGMFLIMSGRATVLIDEPNGEQVRLRTLREGTVVGEISLYRGDKCNATVVADTSCEVLHLAPDSFDDLRSTDAAAAAELHFFVARTLASRVGHADRTIRALYD